VSRSTLPVFFFLMQTNLLVGSRITMLFSIVQYGDVFLPSPVTHSSSTSDTQFLVNLMNKWSAPRMFCWNFCLPSKSKPDIIRHAVTHANLFFFFRGGGDSDSRKPFLLFRSNKIIRSGVTKLFELVSYTFRQVS
jgi:hypothetical protein